MSKPHFEKTILITGGCGFIGSHLLRKLVKEFPQMLIVNVDALTYSGNTENNKDIEHFKNYVFEKADINDATIIQNIFKTYQPQLVVHLAAETHVDRSISDPDIFLKTNILGTHHLLLQCVQLLNEGKKIKFIHISTDEVFGSLDKNGAFSETSPYEPQSPYATSKAASDLLVKSYGNTYKLPYIITNCSNNFGTHQYPEKLIPLTVIHILNEQKIPLYGDGSNVRDWIYTLDHCDAIVQLIHSDKSFEQYCIGGENEWANIDLVKKIIQITDRLLHHPEGHSLHLIDFVKDRKGHDYRYAIDNTKIKKDLNWKPNPHFEKNLEYAIGWYIQNKDWWLPLLNDDYKKYFEAHYNSK